MSIRDSWLVTFGVAMVALGVALVVDVQDVYFTSSSYRWVFYYVPSGCNGVLAVATGVLSITAGIGASQLRKQIAFGMNSLLAFGWAAGYAVAFFTDDLTTLSALMVWVLISSWNLLIARSFDDSSARP